MFSIQTVKQISPKTDGNIALFGEIAHLSQVVFCLKLVKNFLEKNWDPESLGPNIKDISAFYYSSSSRLL